MTSHKTDQKPTDAARDKDSTEEGVAKVDAGIQGVLGRKLRESYDEVVGEQVPDRFLKLLDDLKKKEQASKKDSR